MDVVSVLLLLAGVVTLGLQYLPPRDPASIARTGYFGLASLILATVVQDLANSVWLVCLILLFELQIFALLVLVLGTPIGCLILIANPPSAKAVTLEQWRLMALAGLAAWILVVWVYLEWLLAHPSEEIGDALIASLLPTILNFAKDGDQLLQECPRYLPHAARLAALALLVIAALRTINSSYQFQRRVAPVQAS